LEHSVLLLLLLLLLGLLPPLASTTISTMLSHVTLSCCYTFRFPILLCQWSLINVYGPTVMPLSNNCVTFVYHKLSCVSFSCCYCFVTMSYTDWFDAIRNHPYTRDMIENVRTFHPTDYLMTPSEMHAALLRHVDTADDKMRQAMLHPKFVSARDWLHASIRNVSCAFPICRSMFYHTQPCFN